ncbi:MAG: hypothetical protein AVDCRST_MAG45-820, partial [uncultured Solirubrobacterales bacterium]
WMSGIRNGLCPPRSPSTRWGLQEGWPSATPPARRTEG